MTVKVISRTAGAAAATLALVTVAGAARPALAGRPAGAAPPAPARSGPEGAVTRQIYPGIPMVPAGARPRQALAGAAGQLTAGVQATVRSTNWSGYAVSRRKTTFRFVQAAFLVPHVRCGASAGSRRAYSSHWVGLDGFSDPTVEQDGIEADCRETRPRYYAWYEMYPKSETPVSLKIKGGDSVSAAVTYSRSSGKFTLKIADSTSGRHFSIARRCGTCRRATAEVISEAPATISSRGRTVILPLADYRVARFANIAIAESGGSGGGLSSGRWNITKILQVSAANQATLVAWPSPIRADAFDNYWSGR